MPSHRILNTPTPAYCTFSTNQYNRKIYRNLQPMDIQSHNLWPRFHNGNPRVRQSTHSTRVDAHTVFVASQGDSSLHLRVDTWVYGFVWKWILHTSIPPKRIQMALLDTFSREHDDKSVDVGYLISNPHDTRVPGLKSPSHQWWGRSPEWSCQ